MQNWNQTDDNFRAISILHILMEEGVIGSNHHHPTSPVLSCLHLEDLLEINYLSFPPQGSTFPELSSSIMNTFTGSIFQAPCPGEQKNLSPSPNL